MRPDSAKRPTGPWWIREGSGNAGWPPWFSGVGVVVIHPRIYFRRSPSVARPSPRHGKHYEAIEMALSIARPQGCPTSLPRNTAD